MADAPPAPASEPAWAKPSIGVYSLTLFVIALAIAYVAKNDTALNLMIGAIITNGTTVVGYYFGSSSGSAQKSAMMEAASPKAAPVVSQSTSFNTDGSIRAAQP